MSDLKPVTRNEKILDGQDIKPVTRFEYFLKEASKNSGDGSIPEYTSSDNGKVLTVDGTGGEANLAWLSVVGGVGAHYITYHFDPATSTRTLTGYSFQNFLDDYNAGRPVYVIGNSEIGTMFYPVIGYYSGSTFYSIYTNENEQGTFKNYEAQTITDDLVHYVPEPN